MKKISYFKSKYAAEKDSKSLRKIYMKAVERTVKEDLPDAPAGDIESRRDYFKRLNDYVIGSADKYDFLAPFSQSSINFVHAIPEEDLSSLEKGERISFIKWIAGHYDSNKELLSIDNISKIKSLISIDDNYDFLSIQTHSPAFFLNILDRKKSSPPEGARAFRPDIAARNLGLDQGLFASAEKALEEEEYPDIKELFSAKELFFLQAGAVLALSVNDLSLIMDFISSEASDIEISKHGDLSALYPFDVSNQESIISAFNAINADQQTWHTESTVDEALESKEDGAFGYGYKTNIPVHIFDDGWKIVYLPSNEDSDMIPWSNDKTLSHDRIQEGDNNSLCLGSGSKMYNDNSSGYVFSLRNPENKPIATIRAGRDFRNPKDPHDDRDSLEIKEIRESGNGEPGIETSMYLTSFFKKLGAKKWDYSYYLKNVSDDHLKQIIYSLSNSSASERLIDKSSAELFDWIHFLNKNREDTKYKEYLKEYPALIKKRTELMTSYDGLFINSSSIRNDESRVRKYASFIFKSINDAGSAAHIDTELAKKLFFKGLGESEFKTFQNSIIAKIDNYQQTYNLLAMEFPREAYFTLTSNSRFQYDQAITEALKIAAKKLISGDDKDIEIFFSPLKNIYATLLLDYKLEFEADFRSSQNVINYLEEYYSDDSRLFLKHKLYKYYYGNREDIRTSILKHSEENILIKIDALKRNKLYTSKEMLELLSSAGSALNPDIVKTIVQICEENINGEKPQKQHLEIYAKIKQISKEDEFAFSDSFLINRYLNLYIKDAREYTDISWLAGQLAAGMAGIINFKMISEDALKGMINIFYEKIQEIKSEPPDIKSILKLELINKACLEISKRYDLNLAILIENSVESEERFLEVFQKNPDKFLEKRIYTRNEAYLSKALELTPLYIKNKFRLNRIIYDTNRDSEGFSDTIISYLKYTDNDKNIVRNVVKNIEDAVLLLVKPLSEGSEAAAPVVMNDLLEKYFYALKTLRALGHNKSLKSGLSELEDTLVGSVPQFSSYLYDNPDVYYSGKLYDLSELNVDKRKMAASYARKLAQGMLDGEVADIFLQDLGLSKQAKALGKFLIKKSFFEELKNLVHIYSRI
jgi:hypothetical protein